MGGKKFRWSFSSFRFFSTNSLSCVCVCIYIPFQNFSKSARFCIFLVQGGHALVPREIRLDADNDTVNSSSYRRFDFFGDFWFTLPKWRGFPVPNPFQPLVRTYFSRFSSCHWTCPATSYLSFFFSLGWSVKLLLVNTHRGSSSNSRDNNFFRVENVLFLFYFILFFECRKTHMQ